MKAIKTVVAVLIALTSITAVSVLVFAHGGHHGGYRYTNYYGTTYCVGGSHYVDANNDGICDNCHHLNRNYYGYGHHGFCH